jgi:hypothetical protein
MTLYLLDANVLIRAHADYYPIDRIKPFWLWLLEMAEANLIKIPKEIYDEVAESADLLGQWLRRPEVKDAVILGERTDITAVQDVISRRYAVDLTDVEIVKVGADPFLVAAANGHSDRIVVTREVARPNAQRANRKLPDVCATFRVQCITDFELWRLLNFRIQ